MMFKVIEHLSYPCPVIEHPSLDMGLHFDVPRSSVYFGFQTRSLYESSSEGDVLGTSCCIRLCGNSAVGRTSLVRNISYQPEIESNFRVYGEGYSKTSSEFDISISYTAFG